MEARTNRIRLTHYIILGLETSHPSEEHLNVVFNKLKKIWHPENAPTWAPENKLMVCYHIYGRMENAYNYFIDRIKQGKQEDNQSNIYIFSESEEGREKIFRKEWENLTNIYHASLPPQLEKANIQIEQLSAELKQAQTEMNELKLTSQPSEIYKQLKQAQEEIRKLNKTLELQRKKNRELSQENTFLKITQSQQVNELPAPQPFSPEAKISDLNLFANSRHTQQNTKENGKIKPAGLATTYKMFNTDMKFDGIKLAFQTKKQAEQFQNKYNNSVKRDAFTPFTFGEGGYHSWVDGHASSLKDAHVLVLHLNSIYIHHVLKLDQSDITGEIEFEELTKLIDITGIAIESRSSYENRLLEDHELPEQYRRGESKMSVRM